MRIHVPLLVTIVCGLLLQHVHAEERSDYEKLGDVLTFGIPLAGLGGSVIIQDWDGSVQLLASMATAGAITGTQKKVVDKTRPSSGHNSFPSGHATGAFGGAAFIERRYGWWYGAPAYGLAVLCAHTRYEAKKHDVFDLTFGAINGIVGAYIWTKPYQAGDKSVFFQPWNGSDHFGFQVAIWDDPERAQQLKEAALNKKYVRPTGVSGPKGDSSLGNGNNPAEPITFAGTQFNVIDQSNDPDPTKRTTTGYMWFFEGGYTFFENHMIEGNTALAKNKNDEFDALGLFDSELGYLWRYYQPQNPVWWKPTDLAIGADLSIPTGDRSEGLGNGAWIARPKLTSNWTFFKHFNVRPEVALFSSFGEETGVERIRMLGLALGLEYQFEDAFYVSWLPEFIFDESSDDPNTSNHFMEVGYPMKGGWVPYFQYALIGNSKWLYNPPKERERYYDDTYALGIKKIW